MFRVIQLFVFRRIVHRTIPIWPSSLKPLFGTSLAWIKFFHCFVKPLVFVKFLAESFHC